MGVRYFDHAASSWPKPPQVAEAMRSCIDQCGANPGRGSHQMAVQASRILFEGRAALAKLFRVRNPNDISYALNTTHALNQAIFGFVREGDHVICTSMEHNSVRRPLEYLKRTRGIGLTYVKADEEGHLCMDALVEAITPQTKLIVCNHSSNLLGSIQPVDKIAQLAHERGIYLLVDSAQTAGVLPIDVQNMGIDLLAFPGHKGLLGPQGTGGLYIHPDLNLDPYMHGGTGSQSEAIEQPQVRPDRYEAGTPNTVGIAGLKESVTFVLQQGVANIHQKEWNHTQRMMEGLQAVPGIRLLGPSLGKPKTGIVSFLLEGMDASEMAFVLDQSFQIAVRSGYHCTPLAHEAVGTLATGAVRASVGFYTTDDDVDYFIAAVKEIASHYRT